MRRTLSATLDGVAEDHTPVIITRDSGKPAAELMSLEDFASYEETRYLLQNPRNAERLLEEHRLVYRPGEDGLQIAQCRLHH